MKIWKHKLNVKLVMTSTWRQLRSPRDRNRPTCDHFSNLIYLNMFWPPLFPTRSLTLFTFRCRNFIFLINIVRRPFLCWSSVVWARIFFIINDNMYFRHSKIYLQIAVQDDRNSEITWKFALPSESECLNI